VQRYYAPAGAGGGPPASARAAPQPIVCSEVCSASWASTSYSSAASAWARAGAAEVITGALFGGLTLEGKHAMLFFLLTFLAAVMVSPQRKMLRTPWPWYCAAVAFAIALPNVIWEYTHHWATYELLSNIAKSNKNLVLGPWQYLHSNIESLGGLTVLVWVPGLVWCLFLKGGQRFRAIGWMWIFSYILFIALKGKDYYLTPTYPMLFAAGGVALESWFARIPRAAVWMVKVAFALLIFLRGAIAWPFAMPMMSEEKFIAYEKALGAAPSKTENTELEELSQQYADMHGWPELAASVARVYNSIPGTWAVRHFRGKLWRSGGDRLVWSAIRIAGVDQCAPKLLVLGTAQLYR